MVSTRVDCIFSGIGDETYFSFKYIIHAFMFNFFNFSNNFRSIVLNQLQKIGFAKSDH